MAVVALVAAANVRGGFTDGVGAVVAANTSSGKLTVVDRRNKLPASGRMAVIALTRG